MIALIQNLEADFPQKVSQSQPQNPETFTNVCQSTHLWDSSIQMAKRSTVTPW